jgi:hypothetical protein
MGAAMRIRAPSFFRSRLRFPLMMRGRKSSVTATMAAGMVVFIVLFDGR